MSAAAEFDNVSKLPEWGAFERPFERRDADTLGRVLADLGITLRHNVRAGRIELRDTAWGLPSEAPWAPATDRRVADIFDTIGRQYWVKTTKDPSPLHYGRTTREDALNALAYHREVCPSSE